MGKQAGVWIESRRCLECNPHISKDKESTIEIKLGMRKDPYTDSDKWVPCTCNNKGFITKTGTLSS